jgi:hypothetical protein
LGGLQRSDLIPDPRCLLEVFGFNSAIQFTT